MKRKKITHCIMKIKYFINWKLKSTNFIQIWTFSKEKLLESFSYINKSFSMNFFSQSSDKKNCDWSTRSLCFCDLFLQRILSNLRKYNVYHHYIWKWSYCENRVRKCERLLSIKLHTSRSYGSSNQASSVSPEELEFWVT